MSEPCAAVLVPNFEFIQGSATSTYAYLSLITQDNYAQEKTKIAGSADALIAALVIGGSATYDQFSQNRQQYFSHNQVSMSTETAISIVRQLVPDGARKAFVDCMKTAAGLQVWFADETDTDASVFIAYTGAPGATPLKYKIQLLGGTPSDATDIHGLHTLPSGGKHVFLVTRNHPQGQMRVSADGGGFAAEAISVVVPTPTPHEVHPPPTPHNIAGDAVIQTSPVGQGSVASGYWNAMKFPPTSVTFTWPTPVTVTEIALTTQMLPNGPTVHEIYGIRPDGSQVLLANLSGLTYDQQQLLQALHPPVGNLQSLRIDSLSSPSWIAWRNIQIFGY